MYIYIYIFNIYIYTHICIYIYPSAYVRSNSHDAHIFFVKHLAKRPPLDILRRDLAKKYLANIMPRVLLQGFC